MTHIANQLTDISQRLGKITRRSEREPDAVKLIAVSKTKPVSAIAEAYAAGQRRFGESRVQELAEKADQLPSDIEWHLIGHLQRNKVRVAVQHSALIHSVDSPRLLDRIHDCAQELGKEQAVLLQANISGEESKHGLSADELKPVVERAISLRPHVNLCGFMTMAPFGATPDEARALFTELVQVRDRLALELAVALPELSMGMSSDYVPAIQAGATFVRIGTALFGQR